MRTYHILVCSLIVVVALIAMSAVAHADTIMCGNLNGQLQMLDTNSLTITSTVSVGSGGQCYPIMNPAGTQFALAAGTAGYVKIYNTGTNNLVTTIYPGAEPNAMVYSQDGTKLFVCQWQGGSVSVYSTSTWQLLANISVSPGHAAVACALSTNGNELAVICGGAKLAIINTQTLSVVTTLSVTGTTEVDGIATDPITGYAFAVSDSGGNGTVQVLNFNINSFVGSFNTVDLPMWATCDSAGHLFVLGVGHGDIAMYSTSTYAQLAYTGVTVEGVGPQSMAVDVGMIFVGDYGNVNEYTYTINSMTWVQNIATISGQYVEAMSFGVSNPVSTSTPQTYSFKIVSAVLGMGDFGGLQANVSVYLGSTVFATQVAGSNGVASFQLTPTTQYTIVATYNGYSNSISITPGVTYAYTITLPIWSTWNIAALWNTNGTSTTGTGNEATDISLTGGLLNNTAIYWNYTDLSGGTNALNVSLYQKVGANYTYQSSQTYTYIVNNPNLLTWNEATIENGTTGWTAYLLSISQSSTYAWQGSSSLKIVGINNSAEAADIMPYISVTAGNTYTFSCYMMGTSTNGNNKVNAQIQYLWPNNSIITAPFSSTVTLGTNGVWTRVSVTATAPTGATQVFIVVYPGAQGTAYNGDTWYLDGAAFEQSGQADTWGWPTMGENSFAGVFAGLAGGTDYGVIAVAQNQYFGQCNASFIDHTPGAAWVIGVTIGGTQYNLIAPSDPVYGWIAIAMLFITVGFAAAARVEGWGLILMGFELIFHTTVTGWLSTLPGWNTGIATLCIVLCFAGGAVMIARRGG